MQSINFYLDEYRPVPLSFDIRFAALVVALITGLLVVGGVIHSSQVDNLAVIQQNKQQSLDSLQQNIISMQKELAANNQKKSLDLQIETKQQNLNGYRKIIAQIGQTSSGKIEVYSEILQQLSEQTINQLWLTKIGLNNQSLSLQGTALKSELIPEYVDKLKNASTLRRHFDELSVTRNIDDENLINFSLTQGRLVDGD